MKNWIIRHKDAILGTLAILVLLFAMSMDEPTIEPTETETEYDTIHWKQEEIEEVTVEEVETVTVAEPEEPTEEEPELVSLGIFKLTAYCSCEECCGQWAEDRPVDEYGNEIVIGSQGTALVPLKSIAVDTDVIPYGTQIQIRDKVFVAQDTRKSIVGNCIDIFMECHEDTEAFGVQYCEVFLVEGGE